MFHYGKCFKQFAEALFLQVEPSRKVCPRTKPASSNRLYLILFNPFTVPNHPQLYFYASKRKGLKLVALSKVSTLSTLLSHATAA